MNDVLGKAEKQKVLPFFDSSITMSKGERS